MVPHHDTSMGFHHPYCATTSEDAQVEEGLGTPSEANRNGHYLRTCDVSVSSPVKSAKAGFSLCIVDLGPWPRDLSEPTSRRFLWNYFLEICHKGFLCIDAQDLEPQVVFQDPLSALLLEMALCNEPLRAAVLCFSAKQLEIKYGSVAPTLSSDELFREASHSLVALGTHLIDARGLLLVVTTAVLLYLCDDRGGTNFLGLARSAAAYLIEYTSNSPLAKEPSYQTIMALLRWTDISALCSLRPGEESFNKKTHQLIELPDHELKQEFSTVFNGWISHPVFAFSARLVNPLLRLGRMLQLQLGPWRQSDHETLSLPLNDNREKELAQLEEDILIAVDAFRSAKKNKPKDSATLLHLNEAMHLAAQLLFYSRLKRLPFTTPLIRCYVNQIVVEISFIGVQSRVSEALLFPLFTAGCEAIDSITRSAIEQRMQLHQGLQTSRQLRIVLKQIWAVRDAEPDLRWPEWIEKGTTSRILQLHYSKLTILIVNPKYRYDVLF
jgi:hypothetical protein